MSTRIKISETEWAEIAGASVFESAPIGSLLVAAHAKSIPGYLYCDGSAVSRTKYATLFSYLGITWGDGDGINTFNLPDFRDRVIYGDSATFPVGSIIEESLPQHTHNISSNGYGLGVNWISGSEYGLSIASGKAYGAHITNSEATQPSAERYVWQDNGKVKVEGAVAKIYIKCASTTEIIDLMKYPVGCVYEGLENTSPTELGIYGTWEKLPIRYEWDNITEQRLNSTDGIYYGLQNNMCYIRVEGLVSNFITQIANKHMIPCGVQWAIMGTATSWSPIENYSPVLLQLNVNGEGVSITRYPSTASELKRSVWGTFWYAPEIKTADRKYYRWQRTA